MVGNKQTLVLNFWLNRQKQRNGELALYIRITVDGQKTAISTGFYIDPEIWDPSRTRIKSNTQKHMQINSYIDRVRNMMQQYYLEHQSRGQKISSQDLKNLFLGIDKNEIKHKTLCEAFDYHNLKMQEKVNVGLINPIVLKRYHITKARLIEFMKITYKKEDMFLKDLKLSFITEFEHHLLVNNSKITHKPITTNTAHRYLKNLKKVIGMAIKLEWITSSPITKYSCTYQHPERIVLTEMEIHRLMQKELDFPRLDMIRDVFVFCCFTGFAYAEVFKFDRDVVQIGIDGEYWISTTRTKTGVRESVPLLPEALAIVRKYQNDPRCIRHNKLLPVLSNQRYNGYLKELAVICGIKKELTSHIARHTFATTVTLSNGVPIETVSKMLGHTKLATTQIYAKVLDTKVSQDMNVLRSILEKKKQERGLNANENPSIKKIS